MSICNLVVQPDAAYLVTDSGFFDKDGKIVALLPKSLIFPEEPCAIAATGSADALAWAAIEAETYFATQAFSLRAFLKFVRSIYQTHRLDPVGGSTRWAAAQFSRSSGRARGFTFYTNPDGGYAGDAAWTWHETRVAVIPYVPPVEVWGADIRKSLPDPAAFDPYQDAMRIVHAQRKPREWSHRSQSVGVAGEIRLTKVSAAGIEETLLHEFPDRVGEMAG